MAANEPAMLNQQSYSVATTSPNGTVALVGTASVAAIGANITRRGIIFINPNLSGPTIWVAPANQTLVAGQGVPVLPGGQVSFLGSENVTYNCAWVSIAASGSNNPLQILELL